MTCYATADRYDAAMMRCAFCRLAWDVADPNPPPCPSEFNEPVTDGAARPHDYDKTEFTG